jgi:hypothetical protein
MRTEARRSLRLKRLIWRGLDATTAELELTYRESHEWALRHVRPVSWLATEPRVKARTAPFRKDRVMPA